VSWVAKSAAALALVLAVAAFHFLPAIGAGAMLHPWRRSVDAAAPAGCSEATLAGAGVRLAAWRCTASRPARGTAIYLHGIADNRTSAAGPIARLTRRGLDVIAYDSRAHGASGGDVCSYGVFEKDDLRNVIDSVADGPVLLIGASLGAAVALQHAARDPRVVGVVAAESFSDLRTVATERAPFVFTNGLIARAFRHAEARGGFTIDAASPAAAARSIAAPVLLLHGANDTDTPPAHAERIFAALRGPKRLILVPGAGHNESLRADVWPEIERWIETALKRD
jgi:pimeloyl-ACP methyl ester carboxylesterase